MLEITGNTVLEGDRMYTSVFENNLSACGGYNYEGRFIHSEHIIFLRPQKHLIQNKLI